MKKIIDYIGFSGCALCVHHEVLDRVAHRSDHHPMLAAFELQQGAKILPTRCFGLRRGWRAENPEAYGQIIRENAGTVGSVDDLIMTTETAAKASSRRP